MMASPSRITTQKIGKVAVVGFVDGAIMDMEQIQQITDELEHLVDGLEEKFLLMDFSSVKFLSSQALGALLKLHHRLTDKDGWLGLCGLRKDLYKIFRLTRLDRLFNFYEDEAEALRAMGVFVGG
jgi:anti-sigma B factor antagonist